MTTSDNQSIRKEQNILLKDIKSYTESTEGNKTNSKRIMQSIPSDTQGLERSDRTMVITNGSKEYKNM